MFCFVFLSHCSYIVLDYTPSLLYSDVGSGKRVKFLCEFWDERWSKNRSVTDVGWSPKVLFFFSPLLIEIIGSLG